MNKKSLALFFMMTLMISMSTMMMFAPSVKALVSIGHIKPDHGPVGTLAEIVGVADVAAPNTVTILWDGTWLTQANVDADKNWATTFNVPHSVAGVHQVTARDDTSGLSASRPFKVESEINMSPIQGPVYTLVMVTGTGFAGTSIVSITYDEVQVAADYTNDVGDFSEGFYVPPSEFGDHTVAATDEDGNSDDAIFKVDPATLELTATFGPVGTTVGVDGYGFSGLASVEVDLEGTPLFGDGNVDTKETDATGSFSFDYTFPETTAGYYTFTAEDENYHIATAVFEIIPHIDLDRDHGAVNDEIVATGTGFAGIASVDVYFDGIRIWGDEDDNTDEINDVGSFVFDFTVPNVAPGFYTIVATDEYGNVATTDFVVGPWLVLSMDHGHVGMSVTATGYVFTPSSSVDLTFDGITLATGIITDAYGDFFDVPFNVPEVPQGTYAVLASDDKGVYASSSFTVYPWITISPTIGTVDTTVTVSGIGFAADADVWIDYKGVSDDLEDMFEPQCVKTWDGTYTWYIVTVGHWTTVRTVLTNEKGSFETTFNVPESWGGYHPIEAYDEYENVANEQVFRVLPKMWIDPSSGVSGQYVTVYGTGFSAYEYYRKFTDLNHDEKRDPGGEEWEYSRGVYYCGEDLVIFEKYMGFPEFNTGFVLDFGLNLRYIDELHYVLNNEADLEWAAGIYEPVLINQKGTIVYMGVHGFVIQNGSPFLQVPFVQPGDYTVTAYRFNWHEWSRYWNGYEWIWLIPHTIHDYSYLESASTVFTIEPLQVDLSGVLEKLEDLQGDIDAMADLIVEYADKLQMEHEDLVDLISEVADKLQMEHEDLMDLISTIADKLQMEHDELAGLISDAADKLQMEHQDLIELIGSVADKLQMEHEELADLITEVFDELDIKLDGIKSEIVGIEEKVDGLYLVISDLEVKLDDIQAKLVNIQGDIATIDTEVGEIEVKAEQINATVTAIMGKIAVIESTVGVLEDLDISSINATLTEIQGRTATIETTLGTIEEDIGDINGKIVSIEGDIATITTDIGTIQTDVSDINAEITAIEGDIATIQTDIGTAKTSLTDINAKITVNTDNIATIETDIGTIKGRLTTIEGDIATIETDIGTLETTTDSIQTTGESIKTDTSLQPATVALSLIAAISAIAAAVMVLRKVYMK